MELTMSSLIISSLLVIILLSNDDGDLLDACSKLDILLCSVESDIIDTSSYALSFWIYYATGLACFTVVKQRLSSFKDKLILSDDFDSYC